MKFNYKTLLAGIILPVSFVSFLNTNQGIDKKETNIEERTRPYVLEIYPADGGASQTISGISRETDPFMIAEDLGAKPVKLDKFSAFPSIDMGIGSKIIIYRTPDYLIIDGKKKIPVRSWTSTVADLFAEQGIEMLDDDRVAPKIDAEIKTGDQIKITRVAISDVKKTKAIEFNTISKDDDTLDKGKTKIEQKGVNGEKTLTYEVRREDGVEVSRKLINTETTLKPVDEILIIGTKPVITGWCKFNDLVLEASIKNGLDPDRLCSLMHKESNGNVGSTSGGGHLGLFQYTEGFWADASAKAGYSGASWNDAKAQIFTTAWAVTHGYAGRWPGTFK
jgi:hypothetical protein